jgi:hypothetical protein
MMNSCTTFCFLFLEDAAEKIFGWAGEDCGVGHDCTDALELALAASWPLASVDNIRNADLDIGGANARPK